MKSFLNLNHLEKMLQNIISFFDNLDNSQEYHKSIRDNLERVKNNLDKKIKICNDPNYPYEVGVQRKVDRVSSDIFDFVEVQKKNLENNAEVIREYSTEYSVCRVTYCYPSYNHYYWSCCGSRKKDHNPYLEHKDDIEFVRNRTKKMM
jgi:hypothetical protein